MNFWNPSFLVFGLLVVIPILIHLFNFRRFKKIYYSNVALVRASLVKSKKRKEILKWLLLFIRISIVICIVLAFAKPIWDARNAQEEDLFLVVDNSLATTFGTEGTVDFVEELKVVLAENLIEDRFFAATNTTIFQKKINGAQFIEVLNKSKAPLQLPKQLSEIVPLSKSIKTVISPFSKKYDFQDKWLKSNPIRLVQAPLPSSKMVKVDSLFLDEKSTQDNQILTAQLSKTSSFIGGKAKLYIEGQLVSIVNLKEESDIEFSLGNLKGKGEIRFFDDVDNILSSFFFVAEKRRKFSVLEIGSANSRIEKALNPEWFNYKSRAVNSFDFDQVALFDVVFVHTEKEPQAAMLIAEAFIKSGKVVCILGSRGLDLSKYGMQLKALAKADSSSIQFPTHPLFNGVFFKNKKNQPILMPRCKVSSTIKTLHSPILQTHNKSSVLVQSILNPNVFVSMIDFSKKNDFSEHSIFVPTLYQIIFSSQANERLYRKAFEYVPVKHQNKHLLQGNLKSQVLHEVKTSAQPYVLLPKELDPGFYKLDSTSLAINQTIDLSEYEFYSPEELALLSDSLSNVSLLPFSDYKEQLKVYNQKSLSKGEWRLLLLIALLLIAVEIVVLRVTTKREK